MDLLADVLQWLSIKFVDEDAENLFQGIKTGKYATGVSKLGPHPALISKSYNISKEEAKLIVASILGTFMEKMENFDDAYKFGKELLCHLTDCLAGIEYFGTDDVKIAIMTYVPNVNIRYLYHSTQRSLLNQSESLPGRGKSAFFSVRPSTAFALRKRYWSRQEAPEKILPSIYRYRVVNPIRVVLLDNLVTRCRENRCSVNQRSCDYDSECISQGIRVQRNYNIFKKYLEDITGVKLANQDKVLETLCSYTEFDGYRWTEHEMEMPLCLPDRHLIFDAVKFEEEDGWTEWIDNIEEAKRIREVLAKRMSSKYEFLF